MKGDELATPEASLKSRRRFSFGVGVTLMALSFGIYLAYPAVPFLPISGWAKGGVVVGMSMLSWGMFIAGSVLGGKEGLAYLKRRVSVGRKHRADKTQW